MKYVADDGCIYESIEEAKKADKAFADSKAEKEAKESVLKKAKEDFNKATDEYKEAIKVAAEKFEKAQDEYLKIRKEYEKDNSIEGDFSNLLNLFKNIFGL